MELYLVDHNPDLVEEWRKAFHGMDSIYCECNNILDIAENTIVSPANSYGFMDGGIDRLYTDFFGLRPQTEVQQAITGQEEGFLPVGSAVLVNTGHSRIPYMISAPTMMLPGAVPPSNCFFAMSAILLIAKRNVEKVKKVYCPGLGTGTGRVSPDLAAREMSHAYIKWKNRDNI